MLRRLLLAAMSGFAVGVYAARRAVCLAADEPYGASRARGPEPDATPRRVPGLRSPAREPPGPTCRFGINAQICCIKAVGRRS